MRMGSRQFMFIVFLTIALFYGLTPLEGFLTRQQLGYSGYTSFGPASLGAITVCADGVDHELLRSAIDRWNRAILYFSLRFLTLDLLGTNLNLSEDRCDVRVVYAGQLPLSHAGTYIPQNDTVLLARWLDGPSTEKVLLHELGHVLGLGDAFGDPPIVGPLPAMYYKIGNSTWLDVTSYDVYALMLVRRGHRGDIVPPPFIPYVSLGFPLPDLITALASTSLAFIISKRLR